MHTLESILELLIHISVPAFAIASMLSMGLRTPLRSFRSQLRDRRTVLSLLGANFVVIPAVGTLIIWLLDGLLPLHIAEGFVIALCAAGAPFVLQLGAMARIPYSETAGPMAVLLLGSIVFMPLVVPFLLQDVQVDAWAVASLLLGTMLSPMLGGIAVGAVFPHLADVLARVTGAVAAVSAVLMFVAGFGSNTVLLLEVLLSPLVRRTNRCRNDALIPTRPRASAATNGCFGGHGARSGGHERVQPRYGTCREGCGG